MKIGALVKFNEDYNLKDRGIGVVIDVKKQRPVAKIYWSKSNCVSPWVYFAWLQELK